MHLMSGSDTISRRAVPALFRSMNDFPSRVSNVDLPVS